MIEKISNFISKKDCDAIIKMIDKNHQRSAVAGRGEEKSVYGESRTSSTSNLPINNPIIKRIHKRIAKHLKLNINQGESIQGQLYEPGQYFKPHTDFFQGDSYHNHCLASGNRIHTFMVYLNVPEEGGETNFPELKLSYKPKRGMAISWPNMTEGKVLPEMLHEGSEVKKGKKYIITSWWREKKWDGNGDDKLAQEYWEKQKPKTPKFNIISSTNTNIIKADSNKNIFSTKEDLPRFTEKGFKVVKVPQTEWGLINDAYKLLQNNISTEVFKGVKDIIQTPDGEYGSEMMSFDNLVTLRELLHKAFQPLHEEWSSQELEPSSLYGIRSYKRGASLINHTDRIETHHISSIIIVDKDLTCGCKGKQPEDWPLHIQAHDGEWYKIYAEPGDMILYESATNIHGRPEPFKGTFYRNFYVHYKLKNWVYQP